MRYDAHVKRTASRPLPAQEIAPWEALAVGAAFALGGFLLVVLATNRATVLLSIVALGITIAYPFFKRFFALPQAFLGIAFSFGIPMAFAAVLGYVSPFGWWLMVINLFWVIAYDTEYAMVDRDDDIKIGMRTSAITFGRFDVLAVGGLLWPLLRRHGVGRHSLVARRALLDRDRDRRADRDLSSVADPHPRPHAMLPCLPSQPLARVHDVRRGRRRLRLALQGMAAHRVMRACLAVAVASLVAPARALPTPERVEFPSLDKDVTVQALYFRPPASTPDTAVPLVIAAHGCGGMYSENPARRDQLSERSIAWTETLLADGYAVLWPDSFNSRGRRSVCLVKRGEPSITPFTRRLDILGALAYAASQRGHRSQAHRARRLVAWRQHDARNRQRQGSTHRRSSSQAPARRSTFAGAVAFYPGCGVSLRKGDDWSPSVPLRVHTGELDDWTPSPTCVALGDAARQHGADMTVTVYPGAYHGFDGPRGKIIVWKEVTTGAQPRQGRDARTGSRLRATRQRKRCARS